MAFDIDQGEGPKGSRRSRRRDLASRPDLKRSGADAAAEQGGVAASRLVFDALEPRVLLNADVLAVQLATLPNDTQAHDVLVNMVDQAVQVGTQTQMVERVQVLDAAHGNAVLAFGDLASINQISIQGGSGANSVTIDAGSFGANTLPKISVAGGPSAAQNTLTVENAAAPVDWQVNGDGSGSVTSKAVPSLDVSFTGIGNVADRKSVV